MGIDEDSSIILLLGFVNYKILSNYPIIIINLEWNKLINNYKDILKSIIKNYLRLSKLNKYFNNPLSISLNNA